MFNRAFLGCAAVVCAPFAAAQFSLDDLVFEPIASGVVTATSIKNAGDGSGRLFFATQEGLVLVYDGEEVLDEPFLDLRERTACDRDCAERGLLDIAFHPAFPDNDVFFVDYTDAAGDTVVSRFTVSADPDRADPDSEEIILRVAQPAPQHNGGQLQFGPDGFLYVATGDGSGGADPNDNAQSLSTRLGKILRIDIDGGSPFAAPPSNPFVNRDDALAEIWAYGLRNPWRFSFDRETGDLYLGDVGEAGREEINFEAAGSPGGTNYGWRIMEGSACFDSETRRPVDPPVAPEACDDGSLTRPIFDYANEQPGCGGSVIGGYVYRGSRFPEMRGAYFFADFCKGRLWAASRADDGGWSVAGPRSTGFGITTFGEDESGEIYFADRSSRRIFRLSMGRAIPTLTRVSPIGAAAGGSEFEMTVFGSGFVADSALRWNGAARPTEFIDNTILRVRVPAADLETTGSVELTVFTPPVGGGASEPLAFEVVAPPPAAPLIYPGGAVNAASFAAERPLAPGSIVAVFGSDMAAWTESTGGAPLSTALGGATLWFEPIGPTAAPAARFAAPLFFGSSAQINAQVPWELAGPAEARLTVQTGDRTSEAIIVPLAAHAPGFFSFDGSGDGQASFRIAGTAGVLAAPEGSHPNVASRPVMRGEFLEMFATGLGLVDKVPSSGGRAANPIPRTVEAPSVTIGGAPQEVAFSGLAPGFVGMYQVNIRVAEETPAGDAVPVTLTIGGVESNTLTIAASE